MKISISCQLLYSLSLMLQVFQVPLYAQGDDNSKELFVEAESFFLFEEYKDALPLYQRILQNDPDNYHINYKIGICYLNDIYQVNKSLAYLEKAVLGVSSESKTNSYKEKRSPPEAFYYLGNSYRANNRLDEAIEAYEQFKNILDPQVYDVDLVDEQIETCRVAAKQRQNPMFFLSVNMGEGINDRFEEFRPLVSGDERTLVFNRKLPFYDAVFYCKRENGKWSEPQNLTESFGLDGSSYCTGLSFDGDEILVYRSDNFDGNLYVSRLKNGQWSKLMKLNGNINTKYWESHASLSKDGRTLFFTSNREGGYGGLDIYKAERRRGGDWGPATNLGSVVNSKYNEDTPFVTEDGNTLFFSSLGHYNMGGYDIFYSIRSENGPWSKPVNIGYPLNTTQDDQFLTPVGNGSFAYYSRYNPQDSYGMLDIYKLEVFTDLHPRKFLLNSHCKVEGPVKLDFTQITATLLHTKTGKVIDQTHLNPDGSFSLEALSGDMELQFSGKSIQTQSEKISIPVNSSSNIINHNAIILAAASRTDVSETAVLDRQSLTSGPSLEIPVSLYEVNTNESFPIQLLLDRDTKLQIVTLLNGKPYKTESFNINRRRFVYMITPEPGENKLIFTLSDKQGNTTTKEITVNYNPQNNDLKSSLISGQPALADSDRYMGLKFMADGNLRKFLADTDLKSKKFTSLADLYDFLLANAAAKGYTDKEIEELMSRFLAQKDLNVLFDELKTCSGDSLQKTLKQLTPSEHGIYSSDALVDHLYQTAPKGNYSLTELHDALQRLAAQNRDPRSFIGLLLSCSSGKLSDVLDSMRQNATLYKDSRAIVASLMKGPDYKSDLEDAVRKAAIDLEVNYLAEGLIFISSDSLQSALLNLKMDKLNIWNSRALITHLFDASGTFGYSKRELLVNTEKLRKDPYYYVDLFRKLLAQKASGGLKTFLQEMKVRDLQISTFEGLVNYLLTQSQFHDFNREMVYQLLIDIINPRDVPTFVALLALYGNDQIIAALDDVQMDQFSRPLEVMQYLLSVADEYNYTEQDLLRALLKILLKKGPPADTNAEKSGWLKNINRPALVTSLVLVNVLIIVLLILFIVRKKRRNE